MLAGVPVPAMAASLSWFDSVRSARLSANLLQALLWGALMYLLLAASVEERFFLEMCRAGVLVNVVMFAFNLFPLPPLDGGRIAVSLLPQPWAWRFSRIEPYGFIILIVLMFTHILGAILWPFIMMVFNLISWIFV